MSERFTGDIPVSRRDLFVAGTIGLFSGGSMVIACGEAKRASRVEEKVDRLTRAQVLTQEVACRKLFPDQPNTRLACKKLLEEEYKK